MSSAKTDSTSSSSVVHTVANPTDGGQAAPRMKTTVGNPSQGLPTTELILTKKCSVRLKRIDIKKFTRYAATLPSSSVVKSEPEQSSSNCSKAKHHADPDEEREFNRMKSLLSAQIRRQATSYLNKASLPKKSLHHKTRTRASAVPPPSVSHARFKTNLNHPGRGRTPVPGKLRAVVAVRKSRPIAAIRGRGRPPKRKPDPAAFSMKRQASEDSSGVSKLSSVVKMEDVDTDIGSGDDGIPSKKLKVLIKKVSPPSSKNSTVNGVAAKAKSHSPLIEPSKTHGNTSASTSSASGLVVKSEYLFNVAKQKNVFAPVLSDSASPGRRSLFDVLSDVNNNSSSSDCPSDTVPREQSLFSCGVCGRKFPQKSHLDAHRKTHLRTRTISCGVCRKQFANEHSYFAHVQDVHVTILNSQYFACNVCDKRCRNLEFVMRRHMASHSEPMFTCNVCGRQFEDKCIYDAHMVVSHDIQSIS